MSYSTHSLISTSSNQLMWRQSSQQLQQSIERLSSGLRINSARDDAAGLSISTRLKSQIRGINAAIRNNLDGFSMLQTSEGALNEIQTLIMRQRDLTVQSLNGTLNDQELETIEEELKEITQSIQEAVNQSTFNQAHLFDGTYKAKRLQIGSTIDDSLFVSLQNMSTSFLGRRTIFISSSGVDTSSSLLDASDTLLLNGISIRDSSAADDLKSTHDIAGSAIAKAAAINAYQDQTGVTAVVTETRSDNQAALNTGAYGEQVFGSTGSIQAVTLTGSTYMEINGVKIGGLTIQDFDQDGSLVNAINDVEAQTGVIAELNSRSELVLIAKDGRNVQVDYYGIDSLGTDSGLDVESLIGLRSGNESGSGEAHEGYAYGGGIRLESLYTIDADFGIAVNASLGDFVGDYEHEDGAVLAVSEEHAIKNISLTTQELRNRALKTLDTALEQISSQRAFIGGMLARLENNTHTLQNNYEQLSAGYSRIVDTDIAEEISRYTLHQIKREAAASLMQRNPQAGDNLLQLLGSNS